MLHFLNEIRAAAPAAAARLVLRPLDRRSFLKGAAGFGLAAYAAPAGAFVRYPTGGEAMPHGLVSDPLVFVAIDPDGTVTLTAHRAEMGTGIRTNLPMVLADEMGADWSRVRLVQAPGDEPVYGNQDTDGSRSMRHHIQTMRIMGAAVRRMLATAAAERWGLDPSGTIRIEQWAPPQGAPQPGLVEVGVHEVRNVETGETLGFGELAERAMSVTVPPVEALDFRDESQFRYIGKGVPSYDLRDITTGEAVYGADVSLPGMKYAAIARPPVVGGRVKSYDATAALALPGVEQVVELEGSTPPAKFAPLGGVAVIASNTWAAIEGRNALVIEWDDGPNGTYDTAAFRAAMEKAAGEPSKVLRDQGDYDAAEAGAAKRFGATYYQPHMAHAPMEPPVALADVTAEGATIWAPVQSPYGARQDVAADLGLDIARVTVHPTLLGGGFGRKSKCDYVIEAARLSRAVGAPVRVQWTREDDLRHGFYHTTSVERIDAALDAEGRVTGWRHRSVAPSILSTFAEDSGHQMSLESGMGHVDLPFDIPAIRCENGAAMAHTRIGWWRSVSNVPRAFAVQSFVAELAHELGRDHREVLLELIGPARTIDLKAAAMPEDFWNYGEPYEQYPIDTGRLAHVVNLAADAAGWGRSLPAGEGLGLACHRSFVTYVAAAARVRVDGEGRIRVPEIHMAVDCGFAANPERIRSQMEGAAVMGMTLALHSGLTFENGRVREENFGDYHMARTDNYPERVVTHIVAHPFSVHASGVGEPGVPVIAPAIANGVFAATGRRLRDLPFGERLAG